MEGVGMMWIDVYYLVDCFGKQILLLSLREINK